MFKGRYFVVVIVLFTTLASAVATAADKQTAVKKDQRELIAVLQSGLPQDKAIACKQLAIYGNKDAVSALAPLLADKQLSSWARIALEAIPDPAASDAIRETIGKLQGRLLVGAINSLGVRRDAKAVDLLIERLKDSDADVASAAAVALARIGGAPAVKTLEQSLAGSPAAVRSAAAEGCILCAERALAQSQTDEAVRIYEAVRKADVPQQRILEATRGAVLARKTAGAPLLAELLQSTDKARFAVGLRTARELAGREVTDALMAELGRATPARQALLILALADRGDTAALPAVLRAAQSGPASLRIAAVRVLKRLGNASCVSVLLDAARAADEQLSQTALEVLADLPGKDVDADLAARLMKSEGKTREILIDLAGRRRIAAASAALLKAASDPDVQIRAAALTALGATIEFPNLSILISRVAKPQTPEDSVVAEKALSLACQRMPDPEACADKLIAAMAQCPVATKCKFLEILGALGGVKALKTVEAAAKDANPEILDAGSRLLGSWMSMDAAPVLLDLAKTAADEKYRIRAMRGYIRLARQFVLPDPERVAMCRTAMESATRDAEKKLVLEVLERYPSMGAFQLSIEAGKSPALKNDATRVAFVIAQKVGVDMATIRKLLPELGSGALKVEIIKAEYGEGAKVKDVTQVLRQHVRGFPVIVLPSSSYNANFGGDPAPGVVKQLKVQYRINGKPGEVSLQENAAIMLPIPKK